MVSKHNSNKNMVFVRARYKHLEVRKDIQVPIYSFLSCLTQPTGIQSDYPIAFYTERRNTGESSRTQDAFHFRTVLTPSQAWTGVARLPACS